MKRLYLSLMAILLPCCLLKAHPVDPQRARFLAQDFVAANFESSRQSPDLTLAKTGFSERGEACYYIFNVGETGFVIMAADDCVRPVIGYSDEGIFDVDDMAPALADYLERTCRGIADEAQRGSGNAAVAADWEMLEHCGRLVSRHGGRDDDYLVTTKWNQNYPYNYFCPQAEGGPGGRCYAGCVATAAAQLMRYWSHPLQGQGSYTYYPEDHPEYGPLTANFGETVYDWDNMPSQVYTTSSQAEIEAVALLTYHAGVCVDMNYHASSSGAVTGMLCERMPEFFYYTDAMANLRREDYTHEGYMQLVMDAIDMRWPMVHRGGGHAYVLDGYNDSDMVHFNWGWSGSSDGWFNIDEHGYTEGESVIYNYVPAEVYASTPDAPLSLEVTASDDDTFSTTIAWQNPTLNLGGTMLSTIDQIVVERNGQVIYSEDNVTPGNAMSFVDADIPLFDSFKYAVYAVVGGQRGKSVVSEGIYVGPTCDWKIILQSSAFLGWNGGYMSLYSATSTEVARYTMTSSSPVVYDIPVPVGRVSFGWTAPNQPVSNLSIVIKDADGNTVFSYSGHSNGMAAGRFLDYNNGCGSSAMVEAPYGLVAQMNDDNAVLTWSCDVAPLYGFNVYRDERLYGMVRNGNTFVDDHLEGGHCYTVSALDAAGESDESNETCASSGECMAASNLYYEYVGNNYRIKLNWEKPEPSNGLSGYFLFRKEGQDGDYERIKLLGANALTYTDNTANQEGDYYYRLYAYYSATDCTSAPSSVKYNPNLFYLHVYYSPTDVAEQAANRLALYPNPANHTVRMEAEGMTQLTICNMFGQVVFRRDCEGHAVDVDTAGLAEGLYAVTALTASGTATARLSVVH